MAENGVVSSGAARPARRASRSGIRRTFRRVWLTVGVLALMPLALTPTYAIIDPPVTTVMLFKALGGAGISKRWVDIEQISPHLKRAVIVSEDGRFCFHHGIDWVEVQNALEDSDGRFRGASTITMQTVKNLFLWTGRSWIRKTMEAPLALYAELFLSKRRLMEIYLNVVEWDTGVYGAEAAAGHYFGVPASKLTTTQAALLAAILPSPSTRDAAKPGPGTRRIARQIAARAAQSGAYVGCVLD